MSDHSWGSGERRGATLLAAVMLGAVLYPLRQYLRPEGQRKDGFPLSFYPMFSAKRRETVRVNYGIGIDADGNRRYLPHGVLGVGGLNQIRRQLNRVVREDRIEPYAEVIAARVALRPDLADVVRIEIVTGEFNIDECFLNHKIEGTEEVRAGADVVRIDEAGASGAAGGVAGDVSAPPTASGSGMVGSSL
jgi:hypothetical protein